MYFQFQSFFSLNPGGNLKKGEGTMARIPYETINRPGFLIFFFEIVLQKTNSKTRFDACKTFLQTF